MGKNSCWKLGLDQTYDTCILQSPAEKEYLNGSSLKECSWLLIISAALLKFVDIIVPQLDETCICIISYRDGIFLSKATSYKEKEVCYW